MEEETIIFLYFCIYVILPLIFVRISLLHRSIYRFVPFRVAVKYPPESYWGNVNPVGIRACYDEGKRAAETLFFDYHRQYGVDIRVARIFNTYGPKLAMNDGRVVSNFLLQALKNDDLTIYCDGSQIKSFCYVDDRVEGLISLFFTEKIFEPINLGNPKPITMNDLAKEIIEITKSNSQIVFRRLPSDDLITREPNISKANRIPKWKPKISREVGLRTTVDYFRNQLYRWQ